MNTLEYSAKVYATTCHGLINQRRRYTREHYIVHPAAVVEIVRTVPHTEEMLAAAWLHDTVEDTPATLGEIYHRFGSKVTALVEMLTDVSRPSDGNRAARKAVDLAHTALASPEAMTIKLADLIDNTRSIVANDPSFAPVYLAEKQRLLAVLQAGDAQLWQRAWDLTGDGLDRLKVRRQRAMPRKIKHRGA
jgi:(p)ppGpp synthase/HD superfamily hydrolase